MNSFFEAITKLAPLSEEGRLSLEGILQRKEFPKGHILERPGKVSDNIFFIEKGLTRTFYIKYGKEITDSLNTENTFVSSIVSFITRKPDIRILELLEPSIFWVLQYDKLEKLFRESHEIERLGRSLVSMMLVEILERFDNLRHSSSLERYSSLLSSEPELLQRVPLGIIASYLGMTQETLSRMRSQV